MGRPSHLHHVRTQALQQQEFRCIYCELPIWRKSPAKFASRLGIPVELAKYSQCTAEHLTARQDGGGDSLANIVAACAWCNEHRHAGRPLNAPEPLDYKEEAMLVVAAGIHPVAAWRISGSRAAMMR